MKNFTRIFTLFFCLLYFNGFSQINNQIINGLNEVIVNECETDLSLTSQQQALYLQQKSLRDNWQKMETTLKFPLQFHIIRESNGTGGLDPLLLETCMNDLNRDFLASNVQFYECDVVNYIDDSGNYDFNKNNKSSYAGTHNVSDVINIYFFNSIDYGSN